MTVLNDEICLARRRKDEVEVYDSKSPTLLRNQPVKKLRWAFDKTSSGPLNCLLIDDRPSVGVGMSIGDDDWFTGLYHVHRVELNGDRTSRWPIDDVGIP